MSQLRVIDVVKFVLRHRRGKVFHDHGIAQIAMDVAQAIRDNAFVYATDYENNLLGIAVCEPDHANRRLHVAHCLTIRRFVLRYFARYFEAHFNGYTLTARRRGKAVVYNTPRLIHFMEALC